MSALSMGSVVKGAGATKDYPIDWASYLGSSEKVIAAIYAVSPVGLTIGIGPYASTIDADGKGTVVWLIGGTSGVSYEVSCTVTTDNVPPRIETRSFTVIIEAVPVTTPVTPDYVDLVRDFGADRTGVVDATGVLQAAYDAVEWGTNIYVPRGTYRLDLLNPTTITPSPGTTLLGPLRGMRAGPYVFPGAVPVGAEFRIYGTGTCFTMTAQESSIQHLGFYYPNQKTNAAPDVYGLLFDVTAMGVQISDISAVNPYQLMRLATNGCRIDNIYGQPLRRGIYLGRCPDVIRVSNVHFNPNVNQATGATLLAYIQASCEAFVVDGAEAFQFTDCFAYGSKNGILFTDLDGDGFHGSSGTWKGGSLDLMSECIKVDSSHGLSLTGLSIDGCSFVTIADGSGVLFNDNQAAPTSLEKPGVHLSNCHGHSAGHGMARMVWMTGTSRGVASGFGGFTNNIFNEQFRNDSANAIITHDRPGRQAAATLSAGAGPMTITNPWTV